VFAIGVGVIGSASPYGMAHVCLQPLILSGLALIASRFGQLEAGWKIFLVAGLALDAALGVLLHVRLEHMETPLGLGRVPAFDWNLKHAAGLVFLGDRLPAWGGVIQATVGLAVAAALALLLFRSRAVRASSSARTPDGSVEHS
jgi:hypothetical protein